MVTNSLSLFLLCKMFLSPLLITDNLSWFSSLGWHLCSFRICRTSVLICLPLYVTWPYSAKVVNILFYCCSVHLIFWLLCDMGFSFWVWSIWCSACLLYLDKYLLSRIWEISIIYNTYSCFCATGMSELGDINYIISGNSLPSVSWKVSLTSKDILYL